eukprot:UN01650
MIIQQSNYYFAIYFNIFYGCQSSKSDLPETRNYSDDYDIKLFDLQQRWVEFSTNSVDFFSAIRNGKVTQTIIDQHIQDTNINPQDVTNLDNILIVADNLQSITCMIGVDEKDPQYCKTTPLPAQKAFDNGTSIISTVSSIAMTMLFIICMMML